jgi:hypothetical protein
MSHSSENFKIQQNKTAKMIYVPNTIRILIHGVDLWHHRLRIGNRTPKSSMEPPQGEERKMEKEREEEKEQGVYFAKSCQPI